MGRTIPSFRMALAMEKKEWKPFRNALDKKDRKNFDEMFEIPRLYTSACSYAVQPVRLYPILMSILLNNFKELTQCISEVGRIEARLETMNKGLTREHEEEEKSKTEGQSGQLGSQLSVEQRRRQLKLSEF
jgi:hypothetical protein